MWKSYRYALILVGKHLLKTIKLDPRSVRCTALGAVFSGVVPAKLVGVLGAPGGTSECLDDVRLRHSLRHIFDPHLISRLQMRHVMNSVSVIVV